MNSLLGGNTPCQIGMIVKNIEEAKVKYAAFLGTEVPPTVSCGEYEVTQTIFRGQPAPEASSKLAFFDLPNIQLELIEPNEAPSTWREFLDEHGEGIHHYGWQVKDFDKAIADMEAAGYTLVMWGKYGDASGAYAYFDCTKDLKCYIELLCSF